MSLWIIMAAAAAFFLCCHAPALSANAKLLSKGEDQLRAFAVKAAAKVYQGAIVGIEAASGFARAATAGGTPDIRCGIARALADNTGGANGAIDVECYTRGEFLLTGSGFAQTDVGAVVYASADDTITKTSTNNVLLGRITRFVSSTQVWVELLPFAVAS